MIGLDSLYAMLARPVKASIKRKRIVEETQNSAGIAEDSHEAPQSQLPPALISNKNKAEPLNDNQKQTTDDELAESPLPHIDVDV